MKAEAVVGAGLSILVAAAFGGAIYLLAGYVLGIKSGVLLIVVAVVGTVIVGGPILFWILDWQEKKRKPNR